jgi:hypothetical protein
MRWWLNAMQRSPDIQCREDQLSTHNGRFIIDPNHGIVVMRLVAFLLVLWGALPLVAESTDVSCSAVHEGVTEAQKSAWHSAIDRQLNGRLLDIRQAFSLADWIVVLVDAREADPPFLFFHGDPAKTRFVTMWSGAAMRSEKKLVKDWALKSAPGIPNDLAACFAWHVTLGEDSNADFGR